MAKKNFVDEQIDNIVKESIDGPDWLYSRYRDKLSTSSKAKSHSTSRSNKKQNKKS